MILLNNGDFSFSVAAGDRPYTVHPREVLLADFNGNGMTDVFIADHGYDADPFPGWSNQLLLWTAEGYRDATDQLPEDPTGFTHNAAVGDVDGDGDGDVDILVANNGGQFIAGPYFLLNDGHASFSANTSKLPEILRPGSPNDDRRPWAAEIADLDGDGYQDLLLGRRAPTCRANHSFTGAPRAATSTMTKSRSCRRRSISSPSGVLKSFPPPSTISMTTDFPISSWAATQLNLPSVAGSNPAQYG